MVHLKLKFISLASPSIFLILLLCLPSPSTSDLSSEKQALLSFANSLHHGPRLNWKPNTPICSSWIGVNCTRDQTHVLSIRLPGIGLYGEIPPNTLGKLNHLQVLSLRSNRLIGNLPVDILSLHSLHFLYLQQNAFSGDIPSSLSLGLISLDLSYNSFSGEMPLAIQNLSQLVVLNLQNNSLSGPIPDLKLPTLRRLNLSHNNLNGSIPFSLQNFSNDSFTGNIQLCGPPLPQCSAVLPSPSSPLPIFPQSSEESYKKKLSAGGIIVIVASVIALFLLVIIVLVLCFMKKKEGKESVASKANGLGSGNNERPKEEHSSGVPMAKKNKLIFFDGCSYTFNLEDLLRASAEVLGKGSYGTAYKAVLDDGCVVVVKRLKEVAAGKKEFEQQMKMIERVGNHAHILPIRAYYYSKDEKLLVYDYVSGGSLYTLLHGNHGGTGKTPLDWDSRVKILLDAAKAICHIHSKPLGKLIHGNIKPSNILLTRDHHSIIISDHGLTPLMTPSSTTSKLSLGYRAPESIMSRKCNVKSDVYSFGVVLLETLTRKSPDEVVDLPRWVHSVVREEWTSEVFDAELVRHKNVEEEMVQMLRLGLACVCRVPEERPGMEEVARVIEEIGRSSSEG
ncbi:uncharacterized protein A4U43_UnF10890 [Asparagus officinalis]|uniref:Protein kinase domain-containing protein n=1 Tax=Asparagus officinalis TaxID=4686 RepID=A0A1R3L5D5_ASPOF|nr:probable inactive receptor kinase At5g58300 [Asparagus officinalis]ONK54831.1 uncharacterized protein A4U43_UnF10890 [Asparagus officinalis]